MLQQQANIINTILMLLDGACIIFAGYGAGYVASYTTGGQWSIERLLFVAIIMFLIILNNCVMASLRLYGEMRPTSYLNLAMLILKAVLIDFIIFFACAVFIKDLWYSRRFLFSYFCLCFFLIAVLRVLFQFYLNRVANKRFNLNKILVVGDIERGNFVKKLFESQLSWGHEVLEVLHLSNGGVTDQNTNASINKLAEYLRNNAVDEVVFAFDADRAIKLAGFLELCRKMGIRARILPALWNPDAKILSAEWLQGIPFLTVNYDNFNASGLMFKRLLDMIGGVVGAVIFLILYPVFAVAIKLDSPGPVLFKQKRVGQHGRIFNLYKFRTMYHDADKLKASLMEHNQMQGFMFKLHNDPRVTRVGKWLRITSADEIPQFINVIKGEMSLVGTRPPTTDEVKRYELSHLKRISAKPGITGLWQISGRNRITDFDKVVELDCQYLERWQFSDDIKILFKTIWIVLQRKGAI